MRGGESPEIAVVVPSHDRPVRLRWLLNALEEQTLDRRRFEVVVGHDSSGPETDALLESHPLAAEGVLRSVRLPPGSAPPGANRNVAWREARASLIAFTDDDCQPPAEWLERALAAAKRHPGAIVQGQTGPDPHELHLFTAPHARTQEVMPPSAFAQACNIMYPREVLERLGGFDERMEAGEDAELACRAREAETPYVGAPEVLTFHAVSTPTLWGRLRSTWRWRHLPALVKRYPWHRQVYPLGIFWKTTHAWFPLAVAGTLLSRRRRFGILLLLPWVIHTLPPYGGTPRGRLRALQELPSQALVVVAEFLTLCWGSIKYRTVFL